MPKLTGVLLAIVAMAGLLFMVAGAGMVLAFERLREIGDRYMVAVAFVTAWSLVFVVMTLMRARATPVVASAGIALWVAYRLGVAALTAGWPLVVDLLAEAALVAGFCGYMLLGEQPQAYYRGRLPAA